MNPASEPGRGRSLRQDLWAAGLWQTASWQVDNPGPLLGEDRKYFKHIFPPRHGFSWASSVRAGMLGGTWPDAGSETSELFILQTDRQPWLWQACRGRAWGWVRLDVVAVTNPTLGCVV